MSNIMGDKIMPVSLQVKVHKTVMRRVMIYGIELRRSKQQFIERSDMKTLRWMLGISRTESIRMVMSKKSGSGWCDLKR